MLGGCSGRTCGRAGFRQGVRSMRINLLRKSLRDSFLDTDGLDGIPPSPRGKVGIFEDDSNSRARLLARFPIVEGFAEKGAILSQEGFHF